MLLRLSKFTPKQKVLGILLFCLLVLLLANDMPAAFRSGSQNVARPLSTAERQTRSHRKTLPQSLPKQMANTGGSPRYAIVIHGGAGVINSSDPTVMQGAFAGLRQCLDAGYQVLKAGGSAADAVEAAVTALENNPQFNAGKGAVYTRDGKHELEASIMTSDKKCGAACLLAHVKNPIKLARLVMEKTPHVLLAGVGAEDFAIEQGMEMVNNTYFNTPHRYAQWQARKAKAEAGGNAIERQDDIVQHTQTVGAVAIDANGMLAAATSTGGRSNKWDGRIGDTPIVGAGTYCNQFAAVSGTGIGEEFLRHAAAHDVVARMEYAGMTLQDAVGSLVHDTMKPGDGGIIAVDAEYNIIMDFNTVGMYRGAADHSGRFEVGIFQETQSETPSETQSETAKL